VKRCARGVGVEVVSLATTAYFRRQSLPAVVGQIAKIGVEINTVIDVGAAHGEWSRECATVLPAARYVLFEPLSEYEPDLKSAVAGLARAECHNVGLGAVAGERQINVHPDLVGSSFYLEHEDSDVNGIPRTVRVDTLDEVCERRTLAPPYLLKVDVQGAELDVLRGGTRMLAGCELIILETSFFDFYDNQTTVAEVIGFMRHSGFVLYDIFGMSYRPLDDALAQADLCFVPEGSVLRAQHIYANRTQRRAVTARLRRQSRSSGHATDYRFDDDDR